MYERLSGLTEAKNLARKNNKLQCQGARRVTVTRPQQTDEMSRTTVGYSQERRAKYGVRQGAELILVTARGINVIAMTSCFFQGSQEKGFRGVTRYVEGSVIRSQYSTSATGPCHTAVVENVTSRSL